MSIQESSSINSEENPEKNRAATASWLRFFLRLLASLVVVLAVLMAWVVGTNSGTRFFLAGLQSLSYGRLEAIEIQGRLADHLELGELKLKLADTQIALYGVRVDWQSRALLGGRVQVDQLSARGCGWLG
ncbi:MAG: hypothetical protein HY253_10285 [Burkholderiales bacterium]|nr:hypothetical protein [Burkholderiales bacterium]